MEEKNNLKELFTKENLDEIVSSMLEYTAVITQDVINEASKYKPEEERIFIKGAAWMLYHLVKNRGFSPASRRSSQGDPNEVSRTKSEEMTTQDPRECKHYNNNFCNLYSTIHGSWLTCVKHDYCPNFTPKTEKK